MINGVAGVIIWTDDLDAMLGFYRDTLGLTPNSVRPHFVSFKWGGVRLGLGTHAKVAGINKDPFRIMINLGVEDIHAEHERLVSEGSGVHEAARARALGRLGRHFLGPRRQHHPASAAPWNRSCLKRVLQQAQHERG